MRMDKDGTELLIENPLCGNGSFAKAKRLNLGEQKWATPGEARATMLKAEWKNATKHVLVREPLARLVSGATLALNSDAYQLLDHGGSEVFIEAVVGLVHKGYSPTKTLIEFLKLMTSTISEAGWSSLPRYLHPQKGWLSAKFDVVIATHNIAEYFNTEGETSCLRSNTLATNPSRRTRVMPSPEASALVDKVYHDDVSLFSRLLVWAPSESRIRLVDGYCATCEAKKNKNFVPVDLTAENAPSRGKQPRKTSRQSKTSKP